MNHQQPDRPITRRERLALAGVLCVLMATMVTCASCVADLTLPALGVTAPQQHHLTARINTICMEPGEGDALEMRGYRGSGVVVSSNQVLTAAHVAQCGSPSLGITWAPTKMTVTVDGVEHEATLEVVLPGDDLARIVTRDSWAFGMTAPVTIGPAPRVGDQACQSAAYPRWNYRCGEVQPTNPSYPGQAPRVTISMHTEFGNSGSGVWVDGRLVGILVTAQPCQDESLCEGGVSLLATHRWLLP